MGASVSFSVSFSMVPTIAAFTLCRFALCSLDTCVWPSNSAYVNNCLTSFSQVLAMSPMNAGHCQVPVMQKQTTTDAWIKHRRVLEDALKKSRMDVTTPIALTFDKSSNHANDKRSVNHQCLFVTSIDHQQANGWITSAAVTKGVIGPCPLIRVTDMLGFDPDNRLGAASRTEQFLALSFTIRDFVGMLVTRIVCRAMIIHCFAFFPRKGIPAHTEIISSYLRGVEWQEGDVAVFIDCLPNRCGLKLFCPPALRVYGRHMGEKETI